MENVDNYIMEMPKIVKQVFGLMCFFGGILFCIFLFFYLKKAGNVTIGHLYIALSFMVMGVLMVVCASKWKMVVQEDEIILYNIFTEKKTIEFTDIQEVYMGYKNELEIYVDGKKVKTVDYMITNYNRFCKSLEKYEIEIKVKE